ncbi:MAG: hypothetical protein SOI66_09005 [Bifidobacterium sp.]|jgi:hypothetical protein
MNISMPPAHPWEKQHYRHVADPPTFNVHALDAFGTFAGNMVRAINNMGNAYRTALADAAAPPSRDHGPAEPIRFPATVIAGLMDVDAEAQFRYPDVSDENAWMYRQCFTEGAKWAVRTAMKENR